MTDEEVIRLNYLNRKREMHTATEREAVELVGLVMKGQTEEINRLRDEFIRASTTLTLAGFRDKGGELWDKPVIELPKPVHVDEDCHVLSYMEIVKKHLREVGMEVSE